VKETNISKALRKAITDQLSKDFNDQAVSFVLNSYDLDSYLLEGFLTTISNQIAKAQKALEI
jgi:hypothetical protein